MVFLDLEMYHNLDLEMYHKEHNRLIQEEGMDYIDASNQAWRTEIDKKRVRGTR